MVRFYLRVFTYNIMYDNLSDRCPLRFTTLFGIFDNYLNFIYQLVFK